MYIHTSYQTIILSKLIFRTDRISTHLMLSLIFFYYEIFVNGVNVLTNVNYIIISVLINTSESALCMEIPNGQALEFHGAYLVHMYVTIFHNIAFHEIKIFKSYSMQYHVVV